MHDYPEVRADIEAGDLLFFEGSDPLSWLVRRFTGSPTHVGVAAWDRGRLFILEAWVHFSLSLLSYRLGRTGSRVTVYSPICGSDIKELALDQLYHWLGRSYDVAGLIGFAYRMATGREQGLENPEALFCSEAVAMAYLEAGFDISGRKPAFTSPHDLATSPLTRFKYVITA